MNASDRPPSPGLSVVVTTCGDSGPLDACLDALREQIASASAELIVAWNVPPADAAPDLVSALEARGARVCFEARPGKSHALNTAVGEARGVVVAFTDDDALPGPGWLAALTEPLLAAGSLRAGSGGPVLPVFPTGGPPAWYRHLLGRTDSSALGPYHHPGHEPRDYAATVGGAGLPFGASCAYRRELLLENPYPSALGPNRVTGICGGEDTWLALRLLRSGHRIRYVPNAIVYHPVSRDRLTLEYVRDRHRMLGREEIRLLRLLGDEVPSEQALRRHRAHYRPGLIRRLRRGRRRALRRELRALSLDGSLEEVRGS